MSNNDRPNSRVRTSSDGVVSSIDERRAEKKRANRRSWAIRLAVVGGALALVLLGAWLVLASPVFSLRSDSVEIRGTEQTVSPDSTLETVSSAAAAYEGVPLLRIPLSELESQMLSNPNIDQVTISRAWPNGLVVQVQARVPSMAQKLEEGYDLLGPDGISLGQISEPYPGVPTVVLAAYGTDEVSREAAEVAQVWEAMSPTLRDQVGVVNVNGADINMTLTSGAQVLWGNADLSEMKAEVLEVIVAGREASVYNVMDPAFPSTR